MVMNLLSTLIPMNVQCLLQYGEHFFLPATNKKEITIEFVKNIERDIKKFPIIT